RGSPTVDHPRDVLLEPGQVDGHVGCKGGYGERQRPFPVELQRHFRASSMGAARRCRRKPDSGARAPFRTFRRYYMAGVALPMPPPPPRFALYAHPWALADMGVEAVLDEMKG